jgi:hypothetical protein
MTATLDQGYAVCLVCRHVYRPDVAASVEGHRRGTGHTPRPGNGPPPRPEVRSAAPPPPEDEPEVSAAALIMAATRRAADLQAVIGGLDGLIATWSQSESADVRQCGQMLAAYLARPPIYAQGVTSGDDTDA